MATKKKTAEEQDTQVQEQTATAATEQVAAQTAPEEDAHGEQTTPEQTPETAEEQEASADPEEDVADAVSEEAKLESLSVLADRHRVVSWQQAALCRFMGWADGKMLTDAEYKAALAGLSARHLGGGRRK